MARWRAQVWRQVGVASVLWVAAMVSPGASLAAAASAALDASQFKTPQTAQTTRLPLAGHPIARQGFLGIRTTQDAQGRLTVSAIAPNSPAARAGLRPGDVVVSIDGRGVSSPEELRRLIESKSQGKTIAISVQRDGQPFNLPAVLDSLESVGHPTTQPANGPGGVLPESAARQAAFRISGSIPGGSWRTARASYFNKNVLRVAVVCVEFPDVKHNAKISLHDWQEEFFSTRSYTDRSVTGQKVFGSVNDYYQEVSSGKLKVEGEIFDWMDLSKKRMEYAPAPPAAGDRAGPATRPSARGNSDIMLIGEVLEKLVAREGRNVLDGYDALVFLYAGNRAARGNQNVFWPHTSMLSYRGRRMRYFIAEEGGFRMTNISLLCHETGHLLGLPDLYVARQGGQPANSDPDFVGLGNWCIMSIQVSNGRPQHMCAWCKERLGWITPAVIDPSVPQRLVLAPIETSPSECFKMPLNSDGSEYLLLENRRRIGFDASVPAEGLLIWHIVHNRPSLVEAHGITGPRGPRINVVNIPFPTAHNDAFTPFSLPSSAIASQDLPPVYITDIRRMADGRISFSVGAAFD